MPLVPILIWLIIVCVLLWLVNTYLPAPISTVISIVVVLVLLICVANMFGLMGGPILRLR